MVLGIAITGGGVGDEGKGKVTDYLVHKASTKILHPCLDPENLPILVERYQGGANAGHTVYKDEEELKLHSVPSGIVSPHTFNLMGEKMFINPRKVYLEIQELREKKVQISPYNLGISATAHVTLDYHLQEDQEAFRLANHTSTGNGIKQTSADKQNRTGIRFVEFLDHRLMVDCLKKKFPQGMPGGKSFEEFSHSYDKERETLAPYVVQQQEVRKKHGSHFWFGEGAQGFALCVDSGFYPGTTSSNPAEPPRLADYIFSVFKLYFSSVGIGDRPFITQMDLSLEKILRDKWKERGATTGKDRNLGWFDIPQARYAIDASLIDFLVGTCGDRLQDLHELGIKPKIAVAYRLGGKTYEAWDISFHKRNALYEAKPILEEHSSWDRFVLEDGSLHPNAEKFIRRIEELLGKKFILMSKGCRRDEIIEYQNPLALPPRRG